MNGATGLVSQRDYDQSLQALARGGIVAYPTETFYGLAVDPFNRQAMDALYTLKKRNRDKPISLIVAEPSQLKRLISHCPPVYTTLMQAFWPGPLTLIFLPAKTVQPCLAMVQENLAIRIPSHPVARELCRLWGGPLTATSANISGHPPLSSADGVHALWGEQVAYTLNGGKTSGEKSSTIVRYLEGSGELQILRQGVIAKAAIIKKIVAHDIICKS